MGEFSCRSYIWFPEVAAVSKVRDVSTASGGLVSTGVMSNVPSGKLLRWDFGHQFWLCCFCI